MVSGTMECVVFMEWASVEILRRQRSIIGDQLIKVIEKVNGDMGSALSRGVELVRISLWQQSISNGRRVKETLAVNSTTPFA
jgi:hypothetical protein